MGAEAETNLISRRRTEEISNEDAIKRGFSDEESEKQKIHRRTVPPNFISFDNNNNNNNNNNNMNDIKKDVEELTDVDKDKPTSEPILPSQIGTDLTFKRKIVWFNAIGFLYLHIAGLIGVMVMALGFTDIRTSLYFVFLTVASGMGVTMGAHRLFSHRTFKAKTWLKVLLLWLHTMAGQNCLYVWVRDHRQHHKFSDTDADPHNATRGFFFSHIGWLMSKKHPKVIEFGKKIDMSDMEADPWIMFQKKYYKTLYTIFTILIPTSIPILAWNENPILALFATYFARTVLQLNFTWSVNSVAHIFGNKPYDKTMLPVESKFVAFIAGGEGWHNYHHTFPFDYRAAELGMPLNLTTKIIDFFAGYGAVYDRRYASEEMIKNRVLRTGDGSHHMHDHDHHHHEEVPYEESCVMEDIDNNNNTTDHALSKYIVGKQQVNKLMMDRLEKVVKDDDFNNNISDKTTLANKVNCNQPKDKRMLNVYSD